MTNGRSRPRARRRRTSTWTSPFLWREVKTPNRNAVEEARSLFLPRKDVPMRYFRSRWQRRRTSCRTSSTSLYRQRASKSTRRIREMSHVSVSPSRLHFFFVEEEKSLLFECDGTNDASLLSHSHFLLISGKTRRVDQARRRFCSRPFAFAFAFVVSRGMGTGEEKRFRSSRRLH